MSRTPPTGTGRTRRRRWTLTLAASLIIAATACGSESTDPPAPSSTLPPVTTLAVTPTDPPPTSEGSQPTTPPTTVATTPAPTTTAPRATTTTTTTTTPTAGSTPGPDVPGPGSSGCRTTAGGVVLITLTDPMPGPDFCLEVRQSQGLEVVNETANAATLSIFQGSAENVFDTPPLAPGDRFASEAVGEVLPTGEWLLEVSSITGWLGTLWVVSG